MTGAAAGASRDLFVSSTSPRLGNGSSLRTCTIIRALARGGDLDVLFVPHGGSPEQSLVQDPHITLHEVVPSRGAARAAVALAMGARGWPTWIARASSPELRDAAGRLAAVNGRGRVIAGDFIAMALLLDLARRRPVIYNSHNVESSYTPHRQPRRRLTVLERRVLETATESWMVSHRDMGLARAIAPSARLRYVPNVVDTRAIKPQPLPETSAGPVVLMVADFTYWPNARSVAWLLDEVMPRVWPRLPGATVHLTGRGLDLSPADSRVQVTGFVPDLAAAYADASLVAVPLTEGGGTPLKFVEALAYGKSIVATPLAARGLDVVADVHCRIGETAEHFADAIVDLLRRPDPTLGEAARTLAEQAYSVETLARLLNDG